MYLRSAALKWLKSKDVGDLDAVYTSKYYQAFESWPKKEVWWLQIPLRALRRGQHVHLLCQISPNSQEFHHLRVPAVFFEEHSDRFDKVNDIIHIYLSADPKELFVEIRGKGRLDFGQFVISKN